MSKWKCEICNSSFENFDARGFDNKIYCPLCYYKKLYKNTELEREKLTNIINKLEKELDRGYLDLFAHELVPGRELITNIKNYLQELKGVDKE